MIKLVLLSCFRSSLQAHVSQCATAETKITSKSLCFIYSLISASYLVAKIESIYGS